jgi:cyclophilin family peptidyl-prolyl cis-trans isomerase
MGPLGGLAPAPVSLHLYVYGKFSDPVFQRYRVAADFLSKDRPEVQATIQGFFETQYEQQLKYVVSTYGEGFRQAKPSAPLIFAETEDSLLYFSTEKRFFDWALKRFGYEDKTRLVFYKRVGAKMLQKAKDSVGRSYCTLAFAVGDGNPEAVQLELFDEECPALARNFMELLAGDGFVKGNAVHRVKAGAWIQAGDVVDGSGLHSVGAGGEPLRDESFAIPHDRPGLLGMCSHGKDTNGSQFYITLRELPFLDGRSVIFGRVIGGLRAVLKIGKTETRNERPVKDVKVFSKPECTVVGDIQKRADLREEEAATKLQSVVRGRKDRKNVEEKRRKTRK